MPAPMFTMLRQLILLANNNKHNMFVGMQSWADKIEFIIN